MVQLAKGTVVVPKAYQRTYQIAVKQMMATTAFLILAHIKLHKIIAYQISPKCYSWEIMDMKCIHKNLFFFFYRAHAKIPLLSGCFKLEKENLLATCSSGI